MNDPILDISIDGVDAALLDKVNSIVNKYLSQF
jgi:hypothetical protein